MIRSVHIGDAHLWKKLDRAPWSFDLEITARCNLDCRHCQINRPASDPVARASEMSADRILDIARQAADLGAVGCLITGGEPLLRPDFEDIYLALKRLGLLVSVFTNATLIEDGHVRLFHRYPPRVLEITVYGVTRETYESVTRRPGSFDQFQRGLDRLRNVPVRLKGMALRSNLHEQDAIARFCRERTRDYYRFDACLNLRFDGDPARNRDILAERLAPDEIVALEQADPDRARSLRRNADSLVCEEFRQRACDHLFHCGAGRHSFTVSPAGIFRLCPPLWADGTTCDLAKTSLADAWHSLAPAVRDLRSREPAYLDGCRQCPLVNLCPWCPAHAHLETGRMDGSVPYYCEVARKRATLAKERGER